MKNKGYSKTAVKITVFILLFSFTVFCTENMTALEFEKSLKKQNLVDVQEIDPSILVELKYSTADNFIGRDVYGDLEKCYLQRAAAVRLSMAQRYLKEARPDLTLLVYDGVRPRSVQRIMWDIVKGTEQQEYVANPESGSIHNFGAAVDVTIADLSGVPIDMGTEFDHFGKLARPCLEDEFLKQGALTVEQVENRKLLRKVMLTAGFRGIKEEWWHFEAETPIHPRKLYKIIE